MARARNIKPRFFTNEHLSECSPLARLLFIGLWCEADREGRLEDRPKRLKVALLPYDDCAVDDLITELAQKGFVRRYRVAGTPYLAIDNFRRHQQPHHKEVASVIPAPEQADTQEQAKHDSCMVQASVKQGASCPTDSLNLIPDSLNRIADLEAPRKRGKTPLPQNFKISDDVRSWAKAKGYDQLEASLSYLTNWALAGAKKYADWDAVLRNCIEGDWGDARLNARQAAARKISVLPSCCECPRPSIGQSGNGGSYCADHMPPQDPRVAALLSGIARARAA